MTGMIVSKHDDETVFDGHFKVIRRKVTAETPDGRKDFVRDIVHTRDVVVVVPEFAGMLMVLNQYRAPLNRWINEFPAGGIDDGESPFEAAQRELREEVQLESTNWIELGKFSSSEGYSTEQATLYLARNCKSVQTDFKPKDEEAYMSMVYVDCRMEGHVFHGAKGQLAYELARPILLGVRTPRVPATLG